MRSASGAGAGAALALLLLSACGGGEPELMNLRSTGAGPDEFSILPSRPLQMPETLAALPAPTPGGANLADPNPEADAIAALGGNPNRAGSIPAADGAVVSHVSRYGAQTGIRQTLAAEDYEWRRSNDGRLLERIFNVNVYYQAYKPMALDQHAELARWRAAGARNPSAPPAQAGE
ncbi:beta-barrel assembly complex subunit BamF [Cereibacter ovatus]|uniref:Beta-barrel assembly complex subunit BamF n=1 Tax=Cereibacter ovatus TaxID=439529 RepID=A0A285CL17_9RHOB|nr:DUF3035 domain-containing protein [Cereibacter ovatus]SNX68249.1 beta-barrel assembly complex subunit BamF [Cereibacter ovatus]